MDILILGAGEVGHHLADILSREEHRVTIVDPNPEKGQRLLESLDVQVITGDGTRADVLTRCQASKADLFVAVTDNDYVNMLGCALAKELGSKRRILRLKDVSRLTGFRYFYKRSLGFDVALSTEELAAEEILNTVVEQNALEVEPFAEGRIQLRRLRVTQESEVTSAPLSGVRLPAGVLVGAIWRKERFFVPGGADQISLDDQIYLIGRPVDLDAFERMSGAPPRGRRSVVVMGAGGIGSAIAEKLGWREDVSMRIIERDRQRAQELGASAPKSVMVLNGDATDLDLLIEERIGEANIFVATSDDDEDNMVACQLARSLGVERTIALVNKGSYRQIYDLLGIDRAISPRVLCAQRIMRFVRSSTVASIAVIGDGRAEVLEVEAHFKDRKSRKVKSLGLPRSALMGAIVRDEEVIIPRRETVVEDGDHVIMFAMADHVEEVEGLFRESSAASRD
jgi:trk system potassium uptake protein TrkA